MKVFGVPAICSLLVAGCGFRSSAQPGTEPADGSVHDGASLDAAIRDASPLDAYVFDANPAACFGPPGPFEICLPAMPSGPLVLASTISTDTCTGGLVLAPSSGPDVCVLAGTTVSVSGPLVAFGSRPLVLLATGAMTIGPAATIDVASRRGESLGAGANFAGCGSGGDPASAGQSGSGGVGGSFQTRGGAGGSSVRGNATSGPPAQASTASFLRGGCPGRDGGSATGAGGAAGAGGGAVYLLSAGALEIHGRVNASGAGGGGAPAGSGGGGGGGSGGMIVLHGAPLGVGASAQLWANGGGGGGGAANNASGSDGSHAMSAASGGNPGTGAAGPGDSGDGGSGGYGAVQLYTGGPGVTESRGGGGGGGGVGVILNLSGNAPAAGVFSPPPS